MNQKLKLRSLIPYKKAIAFSSRKSDRSPAYGIVNILFPTNKSSDVYDGSNFDIDSRIFTGKM
ncbi:MAG: hypothetical protein ACSI46_14400 [Gloeotrichia echinulata DVL01]